jgi:predicted acyl esterase
MGHTAYRLEPGHALRLTIAGSDAPEFVPSTGRTENRWTATDALKARHRVTVGGTEGVRIALPVL